MSIAAFCPNPAIFLLNLCQDLSHSQSCLRGGGGGGSVDSLLAHEPFAITTSNLVVC